MAKAVSGGAIKGWVSGNGGLHYVAAVSLCKERQCSYWSRATQSHYCKSLDFTELKKKQKKLPIIKTGVLNFFQYSTKKKLWNRNITTLNVQMGIKLNSPNLESISHFI